MSLLVKNLRISLIEHVVLSLNVLVTIPFIRYLGPERYGVYAYYIGLAQLFGPLTFTALEPLVIRDLAAGGNRNALVAAVIGLNAVGLGAVFITFYGYYLMFAGGGALSPLLTVLTALTALNCLRGSLRLAFVAAQRIAGITRLNIASFAVIGTVKLVGIVAGWSLVSFFWLNFADTALGVLLLGVLYARCYALDFSGAWRRALALVQAGWPLLVTTMMVMIFSRIDQVMLYHLASARETGMFASMMWLIEKTYVIIGILLNVLYPYLSDKYTSDRSQFFTAVQIAQKVFALAALPIMVFMLFYHRELVATVFGARYAGASLTLAVLSCSLVFTFWGALNQRTLVIEGALKLDMLFAGLSALLNVALNALLIPRYGMLGAAAATLAAHSLYFWIQLFMPARRAYARFMLGSVPLPLCACAAAILAVRLPGMDLIPALLVYGAVYGAIVLAYSRSGWSGQYATIDRLFFSKFIKPGRAGAAP